MENNSNIKGLKDCEYHLNSKDNNKKGGKTKKSLIKSFIKDLIWTKCEPDDALFDEYCLNFFKGMAQFTIANNAINSEDEISNKYIKKLSDEEISLSQYEEMNCFTKNSLEDSFEILNFLKDKNDSNILKGFYFEEKENVFEQFIKKQEYEERVLFYALIQYLKEVNKYNKGIWQIKNEGNFKQYRRVIRNLVANTAISNANFINAINSINKLNKYCKNSKDFLASIAKEENEISFFNKEQVSEEKLKAELIVSDKVNQGWCCQITRTEIHPLFKGQIAFLLKKNGENNELTNLTINEISIFINRVNRSYNLWNETGCIINDDNKYLLFRALLASNCNYEFNWQKKLYVNEWKSHFKDNELTKSLLEVLDKLREEDNVIKDLEGIINDYPFNNNDWKSHLIKNGKELFTLSKVLKIQQYYNNGIYVFEKTNASGGNILISSHVKVRNNFISTLINGAKFSLLHDWADPIIKNKEFKYYKGHQVWLKYKNIENIRLRCYEDKVIIEDKNYVKLEEYSYNAFSDTNTLKELATNQEYAKEITELLKDINLLNSQNSLTECD